MVFIRTCLYDVGYKKNVIILWIILFELSFLQKYNMMKVFVFSAN